MRDASGLTPMFRQYRTLKQQRPDSILLFRMGDFYEMFFDDAKTASRLLELTLTARGKGTDNVVPMCGFPYHQLEQYTTRLVRARQKVAICDQVEDPKKAKGLVRREVVRVVTPGTVNDPAQIESNENLWMAALATSGGRLGAAFLDASTGEFLAWEPAAGAADPWEELADRIRVFRPREIVHAEQFEWHEPVRRQAAELAVLTSADPYLFSPDAAVPALERHFSVASMDGFGFRGRAAALGAAGGLLQYLREAQRCGLEHIDRLLHHEPAHYLVLDPATQRNLEIERNQRHGTRQGSLVAAIDATLTPGGSRLLRGRLLAPLLDPTEISRRLDAVEELHGLGDLRDRCREKLKGILDLERLLARAVSGLANARDLLGLRASLERLPALIETLAPAKAEQLARARDGIDPCSDLADEIRRGIVDDPPASMRDGGVIRDGYRSDLDELRSIRRDGRSFISSLEAQERETTGIGSLKVRFNKVFGYFIEVSKSNLHLVPEHYVRKQTIANGERYVTPELKEHETKVLKAQERIEALEQELFRELRNKVAAEASRLKSAARAVARIDVVAGLAETAALRDFRRPRISDGNTLRIVKGRHPVVEQALIDQRFVPNETHLEVGGESVAVLTGPNMGGKSTYLRQVALIALMGQSGSFVPADEAEIGVVDRIFCRVGAADSLAEGHSTFMVEMAETANILHHATARSLLLLDEVGRGTSTFDGLSIAWAVVEHLASMKNGAPRTLFATHYHELTELAVELPPVANLRMAVRESGDGVVFLHRVERGASDRSYGLHVARLAGVPRQVVNRAQEILANIERDEYGRDGLPRRAHGSRPRNSRRDPLQAGLFDAPPAAAVPGPSDEILAELAAQNPDELTPLDALNLVARWVRQIGKR